ncbi:hypothetical protein HK097_011663 [Rhizophlyctis rosea]|uniref:Uncharacterized protein n=1 Tax=Rhizophlyctis rosea TaxID=64517 RepID=A0AAD5SGR2_9FUNG|nr:hypothetical protein HK097_011663 [Rhizophlyctis rosea]
MLEDEPYMIRAFFDCIPESVVELIADEKERDEHFRPLLNICDIKTRLYPLLACPEITNRVLELYNTAKSYHKGRVDHEIVMKLQTTTIFESESRFLRHFPALVQKVQSDPTPAMKIMKTRRAYCCANPDVAQISTRLAEELAFGGLVQCSGNYAKGCRKQLGNRDFDELMVWSLFVVSDFEEQSRDVRSTTYWALLKRKIKKREIDWFPGDDALLWLDPGDEANLSRIRRYRMDDEELFRDEKETAFLYWRTLTAVRPEAMKSLAEWLRGNDGGNPGVKRPLRDGDCEDGGTFGGEGPGGSPEGQGLRRSKQIRTAPGTYKV